MILKFLQFINEELTKIPFYSSNSGSTKLVYMIYDDEEPDSKSAASGILLKNQLREEEIESVVGLLGGDVPEHYLKDPKFLKLLIVFNNLKFLKDKSKEGDLMCEYCNAGPLVIYDICRNSDNVKEFLKNPRYRLNIKFDPDDGATCDHKIPKSKGGDKFSYDNLAVCCYKCNQEKGDMDYDKWLSISNRKGRK